MQKNKWSRKFDWIKTIGGTYVQQTRSEFYDENRYIAVGDIYFRFNKYLTGVTYSYINSLDNIYKRDLLTGDGYSIVNMYNEYDIIDYALKNSTLVDIAADSNIDIKKQWFNINDVKLKPGHLVLLKNQNSEFENDVYTVNNQYFLENSGFLSSRDKSYRFNCGVKLGKNVDKQFFLINNGYDFPMIGEPKYFIEGKSFILKNMINYNIYNTSSVVPSKIIFTDYDVARKQIGDNYDLYEQFEFQVNSASTPSGDTLPFNYFTVKYHYDSYSIRVQNGEIKYSGDTSTIVNINNTLIPFINNYDFIVGDSVNINILSGDTIMLYLQTFIKDIKNNFIVLEDTIPNYILSNLKNTKFEIENMNAALNWEDAIIKLKNYTPYSEFFNVDIFTDISPFPIVDIIISTKESENNKYFDYDGLMFDINNGVESYNFETSNQYISYNLYKNLSNISTGVTTGTTIFNDYILDDIQYDYTDDGRIRILTQTSILTNIFKPYTYVKVNGTNSLTGVTLIYSVNDYEIIIEKPYNWKNISPLPGIISIQNIDNLKEISDILYTIYINDDYDWYSRKSHNERKYISKKYAEILIENEFIRNIITGILYENDNNEFVLKLYNLGNIIDSVNSNCSDDNLFYTISELIYVGIDKKTRLTISIKKSIKTNESIDYYIYNNQNDLSNVSNVYNYDDSVGSGKTINDVNFNVLNGGVDDSLDGRGVSGYVGDYYSEGVDVVLPGPNNPPLLYNIINGGVD